MAGWSLPTCAADDWENLYPERLIAPLPPGALGRPFGESVVVQGKVIEGPYKLESSPYEGRLLVQRINGIATQQGVVLRFDPITPRAWWHELGLPKGEEFREIKETKLREMKGKTFEMRGYEHGEHVGMTGEEFAIQTPVQSSSFNYRLHFRPLMVKTIPEVHFAPADFLDRVAEFEGLAETRRGIGWIIGTDGWAMQVRDTAWPTDFEKREITVKGRVTRSSNGTWRLEQADMRLLRLGDQLSKQVRLEGIARETSDYWWFEYRGEKVYVENLKVSGWTEASWKRVTVEGVLEREKRRVFDESGHKLSPNQRDSYIMRRASWSLVDQSWKKPPEIPKAPPLTIEYLKSCGINLDKAGQSRFKEVLRESKGSP